VRTVSENICFDFGIAAPVAVDAPAAAMFGAFVCDHARSAGSGFIAVPDKCPELFRPKIGKVGRKTEQLDKKSFYYDKIELLC
jgi:hypothetical protein